jgi:hypothetical protein
VAGHEWDLAEVLRERGELTGSDQVLAAWSGKLVELRGLGSEPDLSDPPVAIFGVTPRSGHVLSRHGLFSFALANVRSAYSPYSGCLRFYVDDNDRIESVRVAIAVDGAHAIAEQLLDVAADLKAGLVTASSRRPPAKRRADED